MTTPAHLVGPVGPETKSNLTDQFEYHTGFNNHHESEAVKGALPVGRNNPQVAPMRLYAESISGTSFTVPRSTGANQKVWFYRLRPSTSAAAFKDYAPANGNGPILSTEFHPKPNGMTWAPFPIPPASQPTDFVDGLRTLSGAGNPIDRTGLAIHVYLCNKSMKDRAFYSADGNILILPQEGTLIITTEHGKMSVSVNEFCVVQRGIKFSVALESEGPARGFAFECYGNHFALPDLGPLGANAMASHQDFMHPHAAYEDDRRPWDLICKFGGKVFTAKLEHSPFDVVAWRGNYAPYKYDLNRFSTMGSVTYDHPDPSIFTVLTVPTATPGVALIDFCTISPPRWNVMSGLRIPYYHRNTMTEFAAMIFAPIPQQVLNNPPPSSVDALWPGGALLNPVLTPHGSDAKEIEAEFKKEYKPERDSDGVLAVLLETNLMMGLTEWGLANNVNLTRSDRRGGGYSVNFDPSFTKGGSLASSGKL